MYYAALVLFESASDQPGYTLQREESLSLIEAAYFAHQRQSQYRTTSGATIRCMLKRVANVVTIADNPIADGTELYSRHFHSLEDYKRFDGGSR